jgi:AmiR/NasT family two-component response regulator
MAPVISRRVTLFANGDNPASMKAACISLYKSADLPPPGVKPIRRVAAARCYRHHARNDLTEAEARLPEQATIDKAEAPLVIHRPTNEPDPYKWLRSSAVSSAGRMVDVAKEVINTMEGHAG